MIKKRNSFFEKMDKPHWINKNISAIFSSILSIQIFQRGASVNTDKNTKNMTKYMFNKLKKGYFKK